MQRRRFKNTLTFPDRLKNFANDLKAKAAELRPGPEQDALLKRARQAEVAPILMSGPTPPDYSRRSKDVLGADLFWFSVAAILYLPAPVIRNLPSMSTM